jgi:hypothetical protein
VTGEAPAPHAHRWVSQPVTDPAGLSWKCEPCGETISPAWRPEWAGLGFRDIDRLIEAEYGGTVIPYQPPRSLEERVTALEEQLAHPLLPTGAGLPEMSEEDAARLAAEWTHRFAEHAHEPPKVLPPRPLLTPETARALLRECVTVVKPGEVLVIRVPDGWTASQAHRAQEMISAWITGQAPSLKVLFVPDGEITVAQPETDAQLTARVERVLPGIIGKQARTAQ